MPIYEYLCASCGEVFEVFQKIHDEPVNECKFCRGRVEKLISHTSFQLKGSGWYLTDYARKSQPSDTPKDIGKSTEAKTSTDSSSKPASSATPSKTPE